MSKSTVLISLQLFMFLFGNVLTGQNVLIDVSGFGNDQKHPYIGVGNTLRVVVEGKMCSELILSTDNGDIAQKSITDCLFMYRPRLYGDSKISLATVVGIDTVVFKEIKLKTEPLPFTLTIGNLVAKCNYSCVHKISKEHLLANVFSMQSINTNISAYSQIVSLEVKVIRGSTQIFFQKISEYNRTSVNQLMQDLKDIESGDVVILEKILHKYFEGLGVIIDSIELIIE
jgi:hypothetical protein